MSAYRKPMLDALNKAFRDQIKHLFGVLASSADEDQGKQRFAVGLVQARDAYEDAIDAIAVLTAGEDASP